jgi:hypothetical protein
MKLRNALLIVLGISTIAAGYRLLIEPRRGLARTVPERLHGVWVTPDPAYTDRYFELGEDFVVFGTGGVHSQRFAIIGFSGVREVDGREFDTIYFGDGGGETLKRQFYFNRDGRPNLIFKNQPEVVWVRD